ncbi:unnamed protein product [Symbiodinium natans]|uniref:Uncharacterized protein n=1 Tax=Symbiodinium natans TaxID=878477 RepID=A0A812SUT7_9DINO|nr:unnamed protein product [Symbiodinium natans]
MTAQMETEHQDESLDFLSGTVQNLKKFGGAISEELDMHCRLLGEMEDQTDNSRGRIRQQQVLCHSVLLDKSGRFKASARQDLHLRDGCGNLRPFLSFLQVRLNLSQFITDEFVMPTLAPLALARPDWVSTAEQRLYALLTTGQPAPVDILVAELADTLHITVEQARREAEHHLDLAGILNSGPTSPSGTPFIRTVGQTPKAALLNWGSPTASPTGPEVIQRTRRRARTEGHLQVPAPGSPPSEVKVEIKPIVPSKISVAVVAPGAGTGINGAIYSELGRNPSFKVEVVGRSRAAYDVYPPCWPHGAPAPNLMSFAEEVLETRVHTQVQTMVFGSRGGQVVLPHMWQAEAQGLSPPVPPVVVINGGCAMKLPSPVFWPDYAVSFLLIGGNDNFRGRLSRDDYVAETRSHVPPANKTTAILFVNEMTHMPQQPLLRGVLKLMLKAISSWKADGKVPLQFFRDILAFLRQDGWSGRLLYTTAPGAWEDIAFSSFDIDKLQVQGVVPVSDESLAPEFTAKDEVKAEIWKMSQAMKRCGGLPWWPQLDPARGIAW